MSKKDKNYILVISIHGLIRGDDLELGRDADTGGQTKYVLDLVRSLAEKDDVERVDLVTRRIVDAAVSKDYAEPIEQISDKARIVRIEAGPEEYIYKEQLWDHLDSFQDNLLNWLNDQPRMPDVIHSHYADAGYVAVRLVNFLGVPLVHTGHSLGRDKRKRLLARGISREEIEKKYNIGRRIDAEEEVLAHADLVITSTHNEIEDQYGLYSFYEPEVMTVIPPGVDLEKFYPPAKNARFDVGFTEDFDRFLKDPKKPFIMSLSRADERKNILTLIEAYGESKELQDVANLLIVAGTREDIRDLESGARSVLTNILLLIDYYDLYGKVVVPKNHLPDEVPEIYRLVAGQKGVFINPALTEPFGLTILEAAATGLPVVATENGGPVDIIGNCHNGELVDPLDKEQITKALLKLVTDSKAWNTASKNGLKGVSEFYTWSAHASRYLEKIAELEGTYQPIKKQLASPKPLRYRDRAIFSDIDQNLLGNQIALNHFADVINENRKCVTFGIATGRRLDPALALIKKYEIPTPDVLITSLGTRIHYGKALTEDKFWQNHIDHSWSPEKIKRVLTDIPGLKLQGKVEQSEFKISYYIDPRISPTYDELVTLLREQELTANVNISFGQFLDILPSRASKGQAVRYVSQRLDIPLEHILVAGGSGADEDMMRGNTLAAVVGNRYHEELSQLTNQESIYFAKQSHAAGIMEAIDHYDFFNACVVPENT